MHIPLWIRRPAACSILIFGLAACTAARKATAPETPAELARLQMELSLRYFLDNAHPATGLIRDRAENFGPTPDTNRIASMASTGFGLAVIAHASTVGTVSHKFARDYAAKTLKFSRDRVPRHAGWYLHFVDWETGALVIGSEYSTVDTGWFMAGALYAAQVLKDREVTALAKGLYRDLDYNAFMTHDGQLPNSHTLSMGWIEGIGYNEMHWDMYAEQMVLLIMGMGHPTHPLKSVNWMAWDRTLETAPNGEKMMGFGKSLFVHQYSQLYIDFRKFNDGFPNYAENSVAATRWQRSLRQRDPLNDSLRAGFWGFSAGESPRGYEGWDPIKYEGVVCVGCSIASAMLMPNEVLGDMYEWYRGSYHDVIWGRYGFTDSVDIGRNWFSRTVLGITVGPAYMALADLNEKHSFWRDFMAIPEIKLGLARASGQAPLKNVTADKQPRLRNVAFRASR